MPGRSARSPPPAPVHAATSSAPATPAGRPASAPPHSNHPLDQSPPPPTAAPHPAAHQSTPPTPLMTMLCLDHPAATAPEPSVPSADPTTRATPLRCAVFASPHRSTPASCPYIGPPACQTHPAVSDFPLMPTPTSRSHPQYSSLPALHLFYMPRFPHTPASSHPHPRVVAQIPSRDGAPPPTHAHKKATPSGGDQFFRLAKPVLYTQPIKISAKSNPLQVS